MKKILGVILLAVFSINNSFSVEQVVRNKTTSSSQGQPSVNPSSSRIDGHFNRFLGESINKKMTINKQERKFIEYNANDSYKYNYKDLIIVLHGSNSNAEKMKDQTIFTDLAKSNRLVLVFPSAIDKVWKDGRQGLEDNDDVLFIKEIIKEYKKKGVNKVMVAGFSGGAIMSLRMACEDIDDLGYIASISGSMPEKYSCKNSGDKNILMINGTDDKFVKWEGGEIPKVGEMLGRGSVMPVEATLKTFVNNGKCSLDKKKDIDINFSDRSSVEKANYKCSKGTLDFYRIEGGGHTIPGGRERATLSNNIGNTNRDISGEGEIINFIKNR